MAKNLSGKKPTVVFDFDNTLFDAMQLKLLFGGIAAVNGFSETQAREFYASARNETDGVIAITLERYLAEVRERCGDYQKKYDEEATKRVVNDIKNKGAELLLPGARELLDFCREKNWSYYLLSLGVRAWQLEKMCWVGLDQIFNDENTVFTVQENGGKADALRGLFGANFTGQDTVLFNDRVDESVYLLLNFSELTVFLRYDKHDHRSTDVDLRNLRDQFPGRVFIAQNLIELLDLFKKYVKE